MFRTMCKSKIHGVTVTGVTDDAPGALVIDPDLMDAADLLAGEQVTVVATEGDGRLYVDVVAGERGSGEFGCATREGAVVTLVSSVLLDAAAARTHQVNSVRVDADNRVVRPTSMGPTDATTAAEPAETADATRLDALITSAG